MVIPESVSDGAEGFALQPGPSNHRAAPETFDLCGGKSGRLQSQRFAKHYTKFNQVVSNNV